MERALLVTIRFKTERLGWSFEDLAQELEQLCETSGAEAIDNITCLCERPTANLFIGKGKVEEIALICQQEVKTLLLIHTSRCPFFISFEKNKKTISVQYFTY